MTMSGWNIVVGVTRSACTGGRTDDVGTIRSDGGRSDTTR